MQVSQVGRENNIPTIKCLNYQKPGKLLVEKRKRGHLDVVCQESEPSVSESAFIV